MKNSVKKFTAEVIGTFLLVFIGAGSAAVGGLGLVEIALAFGFVVVAAVYAVGNISGAHINPAVTIALYVYGAIKLPQAILYIIAQVLGAILAALVMLAFMGVENGMGVTGLGSGVTPVIGMLVEMVGTFILVFTVFGSAVGKGASNHAGLAIGLVVAAVIFTIGPLTGASINPARSLGPALVAGNWTNIWVYLVGPTLGGILAALIFKPLNKEAKV